MQLHGRHHRIEGGGVFLHRLHEFGAQGVGLCRQVRHLFFHVGIFLLTQGDSCHHGGQGGRQCPGMRRGGASAWRRRSRGKRF